MCFPGLFFHRNIRDGSGLPFLRFGAIGRFGFGHLLFRFGQHLAHGGNLVVALVQVDEAKCIGCGLCSKACPYGAIGLKTVSGKRKASKCDMCRDRRSRGFMTSCEQHCTGGAIVSCGEGRLQEMLSPFPYKWSTGKTIYVSQKISSLGKF